MTYTDNHDYIENALASQLEPIKSLNVYRNIYFL